MVSRSANNRNGNPNASTPARREVLVGHTSVFYIGSTTPSYSQYVPSTGSSVPASGIMERSTTPAQRSRCLLADEMELPRDPT